MLCTNEYVYQCILLQIFGHTTYGSFIWLKANEFVEKFIPHLKVEKEAIPNYKFHLAMLVSVQLLELSCFLKKFSYCRTVFNRTVVNRTATKTLIKDFRHG